MIANTNRPLTLVTPGAAIVAVDAAESTAVVDPLTFEEGEFTTLTVTALSAASAPLYGRSLVVTVTPDDGITITGDTLTNPSGVATRIITGLIADTGYTVVVKCGGVVLDDEPTFDVTAP